MYQRKSYGVLYEYFTHIHAHVVFVKRDFFPENFLFLKGTEQIRIISATGVSFKLYLSY